MSKGSTLFLMICPVKAQPCPEDSREILSVGEPMVEFLIKQQMTTPEELLTRDKKLKKPEMDCVY
jgi:hypothetical protein